MRLDDHVAAILRNVHPLIADGFPAGLAALAGVNELDLSLALLGLVLVDNPDIGGNTGIVERVVGKLYDGIQPFSIR